MRVRLLTCLPKEKNTNALTLITPKWGNFIFPTFNHCAIPIYQSRVYFPFLLKNAGASHSSPVSYFELRNRNFAQKTEVHSKSIFVEDTAQSLKKLYHTTCFRLALRKIVYIANVAIVGLFLIIPVLINLSISSIVNFLIFKSPSVSSSFCAA